MIVDPLTLAGFAPAALALNLTPGPDMLFCLAQGLRSGARAGWAASAGITLGGFVQAALAGLGLSALIAALPGAFDAIRWAGAAYLLWIAWKTLRTPFSGHAAPALPPRKALRDGIIVNLTNPKVILFTLAFVPQFVDPSRPVLPQFLIFGAVLGAGGLLVNGLVGQFAGHLRHALTGGTLGERLMRWVSATLFGGLALRLTL